LHALAPDIAKYATVYDKGWNAVASGRHERLTGMGIVSCGLPEMEREVGPPYHFPEALAKLGDEEVNRPLPWAELTDAQRKFQASKMPVHAAMVDRMDQAIGTVVAQLKKMGAYENTVIMFASDNGASAEIMVRGRGHDRSAPIGSGSTFTCLGPGWSSAANTPFRRHKTWVHEGGISTPLIIHWPAGIKAKGELRRTPAHLVDVMPTILELAGARKPEKIAGMQVPSAPGRSLVPIFQKDRANFHELLWWEHEKNRALRAGDWKLVKDAKGEWELYDLSKDRGEQKNLAAENAAKVRELELLWEREAARNHALAGTDLPAQPTEQKWRKKAKKKNAEG
jgi:arylsulfatase